MSSPGSPAGGGGGGGASGRGAPTGAAPIPRRGGPGVLRGAPGVGAGAASSAPGPGIARGAAAAGSGSPGMRGGGGAGGVARGGAARGGVGSPGSARPASEVGGAAAGGVPARGGGAGGVGGGMVRGGARGRASGLASSTGGIPTRPASERPPDRGALPARGPSADPAPQRPAGTVGPSGLKTSPSSSPGGVGVRATGSPSSVQRTPSSPSTSSSSSNAAASSATSSAAASPSGAAAQSSGAATSAGMARTYSNPLMNRPKGPGLRKSVMLRGGLRCVAQVSADAWVPFSATGVGACRSLARSVLPSSSWLSHAYDSRDCEVCLLTLLPVVGLRLARTQPSTRSKPTASIRSRWRWATLSRSKSRFRTGTRYTSSMRAAPTSPAIELTRMCRFRYLSLV